MTTFHMEIRDELPSLTKNHKYYYQVQGQLGITGTKWCDFVTYTFAGMCIERIYFDEDVKLSCFAILAQEFCTGVLQLRFCVNLTHLTPLVPFRYKIIST